MTMCYPRDFVKRSRTTKTKQGYSAKKEATQDGKRRTRYQEPLNRFETARHQTAPAAVHEVQLYRVLAKAPEKATPRRKILQSVLSKGSPFTRGKK